MMMRMMEMEMMMMMMMMRDDEVNHGCILMRLDLFHTEIHTKNKQTH